jgi:hypothetical protein
MAQQGKPRRMVLLLSPSCSAALGLGLREGAVVRLHQAHPICLWGQVLVSRGQAEPR